MKFLYKNSALLLIGMAVIFPIAVHAQKILYLEDFEKGSLTQVGKIGRYPISPEVVTNDPVFPDAFPPPSGQYAVRAGDEDKKYFGLGSVVAGPLINITNAQHRYVAIQAKIYLTESKERFHHNYAIIAVDDNPAGERYYRFGYYGGSVYFRYFSGAKFFESSFDPDLGERLRIPGWHTFTMRFDGPGKIYLYVDNQLTSFSPVGNKEILQFKMGVLGLDSDDCCPIISDDFCLLQYSEPLPAPTPQVFYKRSNPSESISPDLNTDNQTVHWYQNPNEAEVEALKTGKKFLILFYIPNHPKTMEMEKNTLSKPLVLSLLSKFILIKINGIQYKDIVKRYKVFKFPTLMVIDIKGRMYWEHIDKISPEILGQTLAKY